ncbi:Uncharacterized protein FWK35_00004173 [Aphis craccivora]|uniref:Uncharacterized protein n=1 Tax=Aphis craccivora TaxID=307492 RepID=A0A6G0ZDH9_APHCR|nr:Uncharacterized protein FWK35_00004173 [Aphis craccivora]
MVGEKGATKNETHIIRYFDECIDFTMMCVFFVSVYSITSRKNASISSFGGGFRWKNEYPWCIIEVKSKHSTTVFKKIEKTKKKMTEK